jgi:hypothetical protein
MAALERKHSYWEKLFTMRVRGRQGWRGAKCCIDCVVLFTTSLTIYLYSCITTEKEYIYLYSCITTEKENATITFVCLSKGRQKIAIFRLLTLV